MRVLYCVLTSLMIILGSIVGPHAEADDPILLNFVKTRFYEQLLNRVLSGLSPAVFQRCPKLASPGSHVTILRPVVFGTDGYPNQGAWKQAFPVSGCGNDTILNLYFQATPDEKINTTVGFPGGTIADLRLQNDAQRFAFIGAASRNPSCSTFTVINTRFDRFGVSDPPTPDPGDGHGRRPWTEIWTLSGCAHKYDVLLDFIPDNTGTTIIQPANHVIEH